MSGWRGFNLGVSLAGLAVAVFPEHAPASVAIWAVLLGLDVVLAVSEAKGWTKP